MNIIFEIQLIKTLSLPRIKEQKREYKNDIRI